jgi:hypothetical protein
VQKAEGKQCRFNRMALADSTDKASVSGSTPSLALSSLRLRSFRVAAADVSEENNNDNQQRETGKVVSSCSD